MTGRLTHARYFRTHGPDAFFTAAARKLWHSGCVPVGDRFFVKFAWPPAANRH